MGLFGIAKKGFGLLGKRAGTIKSVKPAKNLTRRRKDFEDIVKHVDKHVHKHGKTEKSSKIKHDAAKKVSGIHDKYEKASSEAKKYNKRLLTKTIGGAAAGGAGVIGAHVGAQRKWPKYKKFMESSPTIKDGKLKFVPKKKK